MATVNAALHYYQSAISAYSPKKRLQQTLYLYVGQRPEGMHFEEALSGNCKMHFQHTVITSEQMHCSK